MSESNIRTTNESDTKSEQADEQAEKEESCPECGSSVFPDEEQAERVCSECGLVVSADEIDHGPEWRAFNEAERQNRQRTGAPATETLHDGGLSTNIDWRDQDAYGNNLSPRKRRRMKRLRKWNRRFKTKSHSERNLKQALGEINRMTSALGLPEDVTETASVIYRRALEENLLPGRSIEAVATASVYAASRQAGHPRSIDEAVAVSRVDAKEMKRTYRYVTRQLNMEMEPQNPKQYIPRFTSKLDCSQWVENKANDLIDLAIEENLHSGKSPTSLAAAAVYCGSLLSGSGHVTQNEVGEVANVSEVTVRNRYQEIMKARNEMTRSQ